MQTVVACAYNIKVRLETPEKCQAHGAAQNYGKNRNTVLEIFVPRSMSTQVFAPTQTRLNDQLSGV